MSPSVILLLSVCVYLAIGVLIVAALIMAYGNTLAKT